MIDYLPLIKLVTKLLEKRPDYSVEMAVSTIACLHQMPWGKLLEEFNKWAEQSKQPVISE